MAHSTTLLLCKERPWRCWRDTKQQHTMKRICLLVLIVAAVQTLSAQSYTGFEASLSTGFNNVNHPEYIPSGIMWRGSIGKRINEHIYLGIDGGYSPGSLYYDYGADIIGMNTHHINLDLFGFISLSVRGYHPIGGTSILFTCEFSFGDCIDGAQTHNLMFLAMPGFQMPISNHFDFRIGTGVASILLENGSTSFTTFNTAIVFHPSSN